MIDLIATSSPYLLYSRETIPPLANSDHLGLLLQSQWRQIRQPAGGSTRSIWLHKHADWHKAQDINEDKLGFPPCGQCQHFLGQLEGTIYGNHETVHSSTITTFSAKSSLAKQKLNTINEEKEHALQPSKEIWQGIRC